MSILEIPKEIKDEYEKCMASPYYFAKNYFTTPNGALQIEVSEEVFNRCVIKRPPELLNTGFFHITSRNRTSSYLLSKKLILDFGFKIIRTELNNDMGGSDFEQSEYSKDDILFLFDGWISGWLIYDKNKTLLFNGDFDSYSDFVYTVNHLYNKIKNDNHSLQVNMLQQ